MSEAELECRVKERLNKAGLLVFLDSNRSQFLEVPHPFCELLLNEGSELEQARQVVDELKAELNDQNLRCEAIVRAAWQIEAIRYVGPCSAKSGGIKAAICFEASLVCGHARLKSVIEVGAGAVQTIRETLGSKLPSSRAEHSDTFANIIRAYLKQQLDRGGTLYWDPALEPTLQMNAVAFRDISAHSAA
jgi:hypothetical protein